LRSLLKTIDGWISTGTLFVSSFDHRALHRLRQLSPAVPLGVLYHPVRNVTAHPSRLAMRVDARYFICSCAQLRRRHAGDAHAHGVLLAVYGVATESHVRKALFHGVDVVMANDPGGIRRILNNY
jgi:glycerophosphoryl diester phosphodiesterase